MELINSINEIIKAANERLPDRKRVERQWFNLEQKDDVATLSIYDEIGFWGTSAEDFKNALSNLDAKTLNISINSPGGDVFDGFAIYNMLKAYDGEKVITVDGIAASIASVIAMAGDKIRMPKNSFMMIHNPWAFAAGESDDLIKMADLLDKMKESIINIYMSKVSDDVGVDAIGVLMDETTWMGADEALDMGFADEVIENTEVKNMVDLGKIGAPDNVVNAFQPVEEVKTETQVEEPVNHKSDDNVSNTKGVHMEPITQEQVDAKVKEASDKAMADAKAKFQNCYSSLVGTADALGFDDQKALAAIVNKVVADEITEAQAKDEIINAHKEKMIAVPPAKNHIVGGKDSLDKYREVAVKALAMNTNGAKVTKEERSEAMKNGYGAGLTLQSFCRDYLEQVGVNSVSRMGGQELYDAMCSRPRNATAAGTDHFAAVLEDVANKSLETGWEEAPVTYRDWTSSMTVNDFRAHNMTQLSPFSDLEEIKEGEAFRYAQMADKKETVTLATYGKAFSLTRQAIVNDDLSAFTTIPMLMSRAAARKVDYAVYSLLTSNSFVGPTMNEDSVALFNAASHSNYVASGAGAVPSVSTISTGEAAMMNQALLDQGDKNSEDAFSGVAPSYIIVPTSLKTTTEQVVLSGNDPAGTNSITYNPYTSLNVVASPYLNSKSTTGWYLAAQDGTIVVANLAGSEQPTARSQDSGVSDPLGVIMDIYYDYAVAAQDWRYLYYNYGA